MSFFSSYELLHVFYLFSSFSYINLHYFRCSLALLHFFDPLPLQWKQFRGRHLFQFPPQTPLFPCLLWDLLLLLLPLLCRLLSYDTVTTFSVSSQVNVFIYTEKWRSGDKQISRSGHKPTVQNECDCTGVRTFPSTYYWMRSIVLIFLKKISGSDSDILSDPGISR